jgi:nucleoside-diphosphate-sugar epimerase
MANLLIFGLGYSACAFAERVKDRFGTISGTVRTLEKASRLASSFNAVHIFDSSVGSQELQYQGLCEAIEHADACLISIPPQGHRDPVLRAFQAELACAPHLKWIGYLSTVGVYGDYQGAWVSEQTPPRPTSARSIARWHVEEEWREFGERNGKTVQIFRLSGIYGPHKNALVNLQNGTARRIIKPDQVFNRIHVEDIAGAAAAGLEHPDLLGVFNVTDNEPAPPQDVVAYAAHLLNVPCPPDIPFENASLSEMGRSFYGENKRVSNVRLKNELGYTLRYPSYREGLVGLMQTA